jgi:ectoine hydroxylase-related dioxygenase (phytanoyl-CoA dioxygenase family)
VAWHIDADGATIFRIAASVINIWLPLDAVGRDLPSLEIVPRSHAAMRDIAMLAGNNRSRDDAFVGGIGDPVTPQLELGDALIFDQFVLHRTQNVGSMDAVRTACEFRFVRRSRPTLHGFSGWLRYKCNVLISSPGLVATRAKNLLGHRRPDNVVQ